MIDLLIVGAVLGYLAALATLVPLLVYLDRRAEIRDRVTRRVDSQPVPMPGAYAPEPHRAITAPNPAHVVEGEVLTERTRS